MQAAHWSGFFTIWVIVITLFFSGYFDVFYLSLIVIIVGSYVSFIYPRYYWFKLGDGESFKLEGIHRLLSVDMVHILLFIYGLHLLLTKGFDKKQTINSFAILILYLCLFRLNDVYHLQNAFMIWIIGIIISAGYIIYLCKI